MATFHGVKLGDCINLFNGKAIKAKSFGQYPVYGSNGKIGFSENKMYEEAIILGRVGAYCGSTMIEQGDFWASDNTIVVKNNEKNNLVFLYYLLKNLNLNQYAGGAAQPLITQTLLRQINVSVPELSAQSVIADILSVYDKLIENNEKRIKALEEMAQLLYTEWFVKFKFPGHEKVKMVDSGTEYGIIPEGWEILRLDQIAGINTETFKKTADSEVINYIDIASVSTGKIDVIQSMPFSAAPSRARRLLRHGDILWSTVRPNRKSYSLVINPIHNLVASTGFAVIRSIKIPYTYLYHSLTTEDFIGYLVNHAQGAAYPAVKGEDFEKAMILLPTPVLLDKFHNLTLGSYNEKETLGRKNIHLQEMRDLLISQLVTGKRILK